MEEQFFIKNIVNKERKKWFTDKSLLLSAHNFSSNDGWWPGSAQMHWPLDSWTLCCLYSAVIRLTYYSFWRPYSGLNGHIKIFSFVKIPHIKIILFFAINSFQFDTPYMVINCFVFQHCPQMPKKSEEFPPHRLLHWQSHQCTKFSLPLFLYVLFYIKEIFMRYDS